jgi:YidC/Oxa1 family membrane protein insertase
LDNRTFNTLKICIWAIFNKNWCRPSFVYEIKAGANEFLEYKYILKPNDYMIGFDIRSQGLQKCWILQTIRFRMEFESA